MSSPRAAPYSGAPSMERRPSAVAAIMSSFSRRTPRALAGLSKRMAKKGELTDEAITDALAVRETDFVYAALAHLAGVAEATLKDLFEARSAKPIVALCWKAGLSMRTALTLQRDLAQVPPKNLLYPKGGTDYPMTEEELEWQLDFLGVAKK